MSLKNLNHILGDESDDDSIMDYLEDTTCSNNNIPEQHIDNKQPIVLGIDLGTTNSCISIWRNNTCEIIPDELGNKTIPSYVSYTDVTKYVGLTAKKQKDINSQNVFYGIKRLIGRKFDDKSVQDCIEFLSYTIIKNEKGNVSLQSTIQNNKVISPEEISSAILLKLKDMAIKYLKRPVRDVVITVPAHFTDTQRQATKDASKIAGLNCIRMFHEPTAAALAYGMMDRSINKLVTEPDLKEDLTLKILVYDFGGGTLDVSLMDIYDGVFEVIGTSGNSHFGGIDFDNRLIIYCMTKFTRQYYGSTTIDTNNLSSISLQKLRIQCESAKKVLSNNTTAYVAINEFYDNKDMFVKITRNDFENICRDLFLLCIQPIDELLAECDTEDNTIDEIILVGGMTRMPYIRGLLNNRFRDSNGKSKVNCSINPDEAISVGASIQGYMIANRDNDAFGSSVTLMDVTPLSLGVEVIGGVMDILIERNTMIPHEVTKLYSTDTDYVDNVTIKIFEGERSLTKNNYLIGEFKLDNISICKKGVPEIEITFEIDVNGMVTVSAIEKKTNEKKSIIINTNKNGLNPHQLNALIEEAQEQEIMDEIEKRKKYSYYEIEENCCNIMSNINSEDYKITPKDIKVITEDITNIQTWIKEKKYNSREQEEITNVLENMKKKYGVLILHNKTEKNDVKANSEYLNATTLYGKDDDVEEEEMRQAFEKVKNDEYGIKEGMSDNEKIELKELYTSLGYLCNTVSVIVNSNRINLSSDYKQVILGYIDDVMLWRLSCENPTKVDYKEKIDYVNSICDNMVDTNENLFISNEIHDTNAEKLEKLCLTLITMIQNNQIKGSKAKLNIFMNELKKILDYMYQNDKNISNVVFDTQCKKHINDINKKCDEIYNNYNFINLDKVVVVPIKKEPTKNKGMSIMEIMKRKQNQEIEEMINKQLVSHIN
jgi:molecular chaperone DnaK (HSP70)